MTFRRLAVSLALASFAFAAGCHSKTDTTRGDVRPAINAYFQAHPVCLWPQSVEFPTHFDSNSTEAQKYDALVDEGYLTRLMGEKKTFIFGSKPVSNYDLSSNGRSIWTADPQQAGYGNFCYGHLSVTSIDQVNIQTQPSGTTAQVTFHDAMQDAAAWANNDKMKNAFPGVATALAGPKANSANLTQTTSGWQVTSVASDIPSQSSTPDTAPALGPKSNDYGVVGTKQASPAP